MPAAADVTADQGPDHGRDVELRNVSHTYGRGAKALTALDPLDLVVDHGQFVCIVGPSGCGKTTLLQMVAGFLRPTTGEILVGGEPVDGTAPDRGVVFQQPNLYPWLSVRPDVWCSTSSARSPGNGTARRMHGPHPPSSSSAIACVRRSSEGLTRLPRR